MKKSNDGPDEKIPSYLGEKIHWRYYIIHRDSSRRDSSRLSNCRDTHREFSVTTDNNNNFIVIKSDIYIYKVTYIYIYIHILQNNNIDHYSRPVHPYQNKLCATCRLRRVGSNSYPPPPPPHTRTHIHARARPHDGLFFARSPSACQIRGRSAGPGVSAIMLIKSESGQDVREGRGGGRREGDERVTSSQRVRSAGISCG